MLLALWTGQREGDLLRLRWWQYDGQFLRNILPNKTITKRTPKGKRLPPIPVGGPLKAALDAARVGRAKDERILLNSRGKPWSEDGFRVSFRAACRDAKVTGVTFHDLRGTAVSRLAPAGATEPEIASITGHSLRDVRSMIDRSAMRGWRQPPSPSLRECRCPRRRLLHE